MNVTRSVKKEDVDKRWYLVDAKDQVLGRLSCNLAKILRGKHRPCFTPHVDGGDFIVVVNAEKVKLTGKKSETKVYRHYSGYPGGLKTKTFEELKEKDPGEIIIHAMRGMLPHNKLGKQIIKKLKVYGGDKHPHQAQTPELISITK